MLLVKPSVTLLHINTDTLGLIEAAGRTCYKSEDKITADSAPKFAEMILKVTCAVVRLTGLVPCWMPRTTTKICAH